MKLVHVEALIATYTAGAAVAFVWSAYARALHLRVPRWVFVVWPIGLVWLPALALWSLHRRLEDYFAGGVPEERRRTGKMSAREIRDHFEDFR